MEVMEKALVDHSQGGLVRDCRYRGQVTACVESVGQVRHQKKKTPTQTTVRRRQVPRFARSLSELVAWAQLC